MLPTRTRHAALRLLPVAVFMLLLCPSARATSIRLMNLQELADHSDRIFLGVCTAVETGPDENGSPCTRSTFAVSDVVHGAVAGGITIKQFGSRETFTDDQGRRFGFRAEGMPEYEVGGEYLLFLNNDSPLGFCGPVGLMQGAFEVRRGEDGKGAPEVVNGIDNRNLFMDTTIPLDRRLAERQARGGAPLEDERVSGPIPYEDLAGLVRGLKSGARLDVKEANRRFAKTGREGETRELEGGAGNVY